MNASILRAVVAALGADGFILKLGTAAAVFRGSVMVGVHAVDLRLVYEDLEFAVPPRVFVDNPEVLGRPVLPHLDEAGELCVVESRAYVADRYHAAGQARGLVARAVEVLIHGLTRHATAEIAAELPAHWGGKLFEVDGGALVGPLQSLSEPGKGLRVGLRTKPSQPMVGVAVTTAAALSFSESQARPDTLQALLDWLHAWDPALESAVLSGFGDAGANDPVILIQAPNGVIGARLLVSGQGARRIKALARSGGWRRVLSGPFGRGLRIERLRTSRSDLAHALERNGDGAMPLAGKQIAVIGCGSIGGFFARSLAQLGAGFGGGRLLLIDDETLSIGNIGRHVLGMPHVGKLKVAGCRALILADLPDCALTARGFAVQSQRSLVSGMDLICDATGEQSVSEMINAWMIEARRAETDFPEVLHTWIEGAGAAAQTFFSSDPAFACLRCLTPDHEALPRFSPLRDSTGTVLVGACGEQPFTPYGPAAPMTAAALAVQHAADWAQGRPRPLLRTLRLDWTATREIKPTNPDPSPRCPACQGG